MNGVIITQIERCDSYKDCLISIGSQDKVTVLSRQLQDLSPPPPPPVSSLYGRRFNTASE